MPRTVPPGRFIVRMLALTVVWLLVAVAVNVLVDPYDVLGMPRIAGLNAHKPMANIVTYMTKPYQLARQKPVTLLLGSSRADIGLDAASPAWPAANRPVFNFGVPGQEVGFALGGLRDATAAGALKTVLIILEFETAIAPEFVQRAALGIDGRWTIAPDGHPNPLHTRQHLLDIVRSTLSATALRHSLLTLSAANRSNQSDIAPDGTSADGLFSNDIAEDGYAPQFDKKDLQYAARLRDMLARRLPPPFDGLEQLRKLLAFCREHAIRPVFVIPPIHADILEVYDMNGIWNLFEDYKRGLATLIAAQPDGASLWDFSGFDAIATEPVPPRGDRHTQMQWFWDPLHFKKNIGNRIITRIFNGGEADFGVQLTPDDVNAHLDAIRAARAAYRLAHPEHLARLHALLDPAK